MDKRITRLANSGATSVLMFGKRWELSPGTWGVRVPRKLGPPRMRFKPSPMMLVPDVEFVAGKPIPDFAKAEVYKIDDEPYVDPALVGGMCILESEYRRTRCVHERTFVRQRRNR